MYREFIGKGHDSQEAPVDSGLRSEQRGIPFANWRLRDLPRTQNRVQPRVCDCVCSRFDQRVLRWTIALIKDGEDLNDGTDLSFEKA